MKVGVHLIGYVINGTLSLNFIFKIRAVISFSRPIWKIIFNFNTYTLNVYYVNTSFYANCTRTRKQLCFKYWYIDKNSIDSNFFNEKVATPLLKSVTCYITRTRFFTNYSNAQTWQGFQIVLSNKKSESPSVNSVTWYTTRTRLCCQCFR